MSTRIIAGQRRGMIIRTPRGRQTRPTLGRVRESLFMILAPRLEGARVLDLFAGSGALGLEALSRGAACCVFVDQAHGAIAALRANVAQLGWRDRAEIVAHNALRWLAAPPRRPFDLILLDPPYGEETAGRALRRLADALDAWLAPDGVVVAQIGRRDPLDEAFGALRAFRWESYSETRIGFFRRAEEA
ncbi:MAG TPA: 16S rRNA (guanine(966)-N(2))-methyltransferase RsmD [Candidatus Sumerlaeota bacterium]|nr:16S rRNA (guanine(966)-N(2))-methyltransferase RsmD [Candidatus Sumerlaeota bacterium]HPK02415.1 16S rRNA (guanine(966)-N(2))-methyltransferase RsmD [Candidatus Sumerlaeota bacterium]